MFQPSFRTSYGPALANEPRAPTIPAIPAEALRLAALLDRQADELLHEGRHAQAERLSHMALECRCRATGSRA